jgi:hypothetical protein
MDSFYIHSLRRNPGSIFGIFFSSYFIVCKLQKDHGSVTFEGICDAVRLSTEQCTPLTKEEIVAYVGVIYEAILTTKYLVTGPCLCIKPEILQNINTYFQEIVRVLEEKKSECAQNNIEIEFCLVVFKREVDWFMRIV